jgi:putative ABC transport system permease protein
MNIFQFAFRNVLRNKRRSLITLLAVGVGFMAINVFGGYTARTFTGLQTSAIYGEGNGHLTIFKKGFLTEGKMNPKQYMITAEEIGQITNLLTKNPAVKRIIPKMDLSGLISNGMISTIFIANGIAAEDEAFLTTDYPYRGEGQPINAQQPSGAVMASGLAKMLNFKVGDTAVIMSNTLDGQMNALDMNVAGVVNTGFEATNDKFLIMPLQFAQSLYDTTSVDRLVVVLNDTVQTASMRQWLQAQLPTINFQAEIKSWDEMSIMYTKVKGLFDMIFLFIFCIVLVIVVTSVVNTMTMSVVERTQEIGTLRALGLKRRDVLRIFGAEGFMIGLLGTGIGFVGTILTILLIALSKLSYIPPGVDTPVPIEVAFAPSNMLVSAVFLIVLSFIAAISPSFRASRLKIVDALGHI